MIQVTYDPILGTLSDQTKKRLMKNITKKCNERDDDMKSCIANSDEKTLDSKVLHHVSEKMRLKGKHNKACYDPDVLHNFNHFVIEDNISSIEDNLQLSSKSKVEVNDVL